MVNSLSQAKTQPIDLWNTKQKINRCETSHTLGSEVVILIVRKTLSRLLHTSSSVLPSITSNWPFGSETKQTSGSPSHSFCCHIQGLHCSILDQKIIQWAQQPGEIKLHESAICIAVFCLSPVSIQKFIPAFLSTSIVSGTPSWNGMQENINKRIKMSNLKTNSPNTKSNFQKQISVQTH